MTGIVLCGGQSKRMGTDKGLIKQDEIEWAKSAFDKLSAVDIKPVLSVNPQQAENYQLIFEPSLLIKDAANIGIKGPLLGIISVHLIFPSEDLLVLACDMPLMDITLLEQLLNCRKANDSFEAYIFTKTGEPEPLCGVYSRTGLSKVLMMYEEKTLLKHSMKFIVGQLQTFFIPLQTSQEKFFTNINTHTELNGL